MSESTFSQRYASGDSNTAGAFAFDTISAKDYAVSKLAFGAVGSVTYVSSSDPLPVTISGVATASNQTTANGLLTTIDADTGAIATSVASLDTKTPALGQALAAASVPVVLTAAQLSTLTPPAAITGFALESGGNLAAAATDLAAIEVLLTSISAAQLPDSHNVTVDNPSIAVTGTFWQATQPVSAASLPLPSGASTAAKQPALGTAGTASADVITVQGVASMTPLAVSDNGSTLSIDDGGGIITVDGTVAFSNTTIAVTNAGTFAVQAAQSGTWTVTGTGGTFPVTDSGGSLTVDAPVGTPVFVRLSDGSSAISTLPVSLASVPSHAVTNAGTFAVQAAQSGTWSVRAQDGSGNALTSATRGSERALSVQIVDGSGTQITSFGGSGGGGTEYTEGDTDASITGTAILWEDGADTLATVSANNPLPVLAVGNGTFAVQIDGAALSTLVDIETNTDSGAVVGNGAASTAQRVTLANDSTGVIATVSTVTTLTGGGIAHDSADSGNPHKIGAKATTALSGLTLVANSDRTDLYAGIDGVQITRPYTGLEDIVSGVAAITDGSSTSVIAAAGSGVKVYITSVIIANTSATAVTVDIRDGSAGTVKATFPVPANTAGVVMSLPVPLAFSANTAVCADPSASASTITVTLVGFKSKV